MKRTMTNVTVSVVLALVCLALFASSAQAIQIRAETGETLPSSIIVDESLTVMITDDAGTAIDGVAEGARVRYILPADGGTPIPVDVGADGKTVNPYQPPMTGVLNIAVSYGTTLIASQTVNVVTAETQALDRVEISPDHADLPIRDTNPFAATCYATDATGGGVIAGCTLTWTCDSHSVGTIDSTGLFTACGVGAATVTVTATYGSATETDTADVTVNASTETVPVDGDNFTETSIDAGTAADIAVSGTFDNNVTGSIEITPISDPEGAVGSYEFTGNDVALLGLTVTHDASITAELANGNDTIRIEICYNATELASKNIDPSTLAIWRFDGTEWVKMVEGNDPCIANGRQDTCVWIEVNNLSVFALAGIVTTSSDTDTDTSRGGGSGGGTYPPAPTPTVTPTSPSSSTTPDTTATAERTASQAATKKPTVKATTAPVSGGDTTPDAPEKKGLPGFEGVFAIAGLLAISYVMMRRKR